MGIPKFYRYLSERYPLINEVVTSPQYLPVCDYLYLDLNGVIHNATHGDSVTQGVRSEETVADYVMGYISHIFKQIKPRKLMFIAVDGVAPRAKLNQQRSRRFRSAYDSMEEVKKSGYTGSVFDSNCITPGTEFMYNVDKILQYFINKKLLEDPLWKDVQVIYSSHSDPGEGEHKIMSFIRSFYTDPNHNLTERHCIYGLDADLILLSLSLHDVNVVLLREVINFFSFMDTKEIEDRAVSQSQWQILHVGMLREYLLADLIPLNHDWIQSQDTERLLDDFIFIMILLGDDFLPELPSLDINEGSIQLLIDLYKEVISTVKGFLVEDAKPVLPVLQIILSKIGEIEENLFLQREIQEKENAKKPKKNQTRQSSPPSLHPENAVPGGLPVIKTDAYMRSVLGTDYNNYRIRYYFEKLNIRPTDKEVIDDMCKCYYEGLQWILLYYYRGVPSWDWYYPYHYAPLAFDLATYDMLYQPFSLGKPFKPFLQQLGCLPPQSSSILPASYRKLVLDEQSPIVQFYPSDFAIDMNHKRNPWEGVNLIPFIDEKALQKAVKEFHCNEDLTEAEKERNAFRPASLYSRKNPGEMHKVSLPFKSTEFPPFMCPEYRQDYIIPKPQGKQECVIHDSALPGSFFIPVRQCKTSIQALNIVTTGRSSKHSTVVLSFPNQLKQVTQAILTNLAKSSCDKIVRYPIGHHRCAWVNSLYTRTLHAYIVSDHVEIEKLTSDEQEAIAPVFDQMASNALSGKFNVIGLGGLDIGDTTILAELYPVIGSQRDPSTGSVEFRYATDSILYPYHLLSAGSDENTKRGYDQRLCVLPSIPLSTLVYPNTPCIFFGTTQYQSIHLLGCQGFIKEVKEKTVTIRLTKTPGFIQAGHKALSNMKDEKWYSLYDLSGILKLNGRSILKIAGYYPIFDKSSQSKIAQIGLLWINRDRLLPRMVQRKMHKLEYTEDYICALPYAPLAVPFADIEEQDRYGMNDVYFSHDALVILMEYRNTFRKLFEHIRDADGSNDLDTLNISRSDIMKVHKWVENYHFDAEPRMDRDSLVCSTAEAKALQDATQKMNSKSIKVTLSCPHSFISFWEREYLTICPQETKKLVPMIGDRIVVTGGNDVPFGSYGFVIGVHPKTHMVEIVTDHSFIGGTTLHGLLTIPRRGAVISWDYCYPIR